MFVKGMKRKIFATILLIITSLLMMVGTASADGERSHRLIVQLERPPLAEWMQTSEATLRSAESKAYITALEAEQAQFVANLGQYLPGATTTGYINESGQRVMGQYHLLVNAIAIDPGETSLDEARRTLSFAPGVRAVYFDNVYEPNLYTSSFIINAPEMWFGHFGGRDDAGRGMKVASIDAGLHHDAPMFAGEGFTYPEGFPDGGLGDMANNTGKIIASRAYFRPWDAPVMGSGNSWPGAEDSSHGTHTASIAVGNAVEPLFFGFNPGTSSGIAPGAWVMSYKVFYESVNEISSVFTVELLAAMEDAVMDGANVINNSWGSGATSIGGQFDIVDTALRNASGTEVFVAMAQGNEGPGEASGDHPSADYINVAATTTDGTLGGGKLSVEGDESLVDLPYGTAVFGPVLDGGIVITYSAVTAASVDPDNVDGCEEWEGTPFAGSAAVISRGECFFSTKAYYAQLAGAELVIIYNNDGDSTISMSCGEFCEPGVITVTSLSVGQSVGESIVAADEASDEPVIVRIDAVAEQLGAQADIVAAFSSRGPAASGILKPDIAAPGVNILAQGYGTGEGEDAHTGYGQVSGTSMAAPHVAGAATMLRALYPDWTNGNIKSALMSTAKYVDVFNADGTPAQPLDIGAGRLDLTYAADPHLMFDPPSLSFAHMMTGTSKSLEVMVTNITDSAQEFDVYTEFTGGGFVTITDVAGVSVSPATFNIAAGETTTLTISFDSAAASVGDNQGYIIVESAERKLHLPMWARVHPEPSAAEVLLIDNDFSDALGYSDVTGYYATTLDALGIMYDIWNADANLNVPLSLRPLEFWNSYDAVIVYTGNHYQPDGTFNIATPLTEVDMAALTEYANGGGTLIVMGQDASSVMGAGDTDFTDSENTLFSFILGGDKGPLQDSVSNSAIPTRTIDSDPTAPPAWQGIELDMSAPVVTTATLSGDSTATGGAQFSYDATNGIVSYAVTVGASVTNPISVTAAHVHTGTADTTGDVLINIFPFTTTQLITDTPLTLSGVFTGFDEGTLLSDGYYINVHTEANPAGEVRAQISVVPSGDGLGNQLYIDELDNSKDAFYGRSPAPSDIANPAYGSPFEYRSVLSYPDPSNIMSGTVTMIHRDQPSLERPGISFDGRVVYSSVGLEGVNNGTGFTEREALLDLFLTWAQDEPVASVSTSGMLSGTMTFDASLTSNVETEAHQYRWDFGDGMITEPFGVGTITHDYGGVCPTGQPRVEIVDTLGNVALAEFNVCETTAVSLRDVTADHSSTLVLMGMITGLLTVAAVGRGVYSRK